MRKGKRRGKKSFPNRPGWKSSGDRPIANESCTNHRKKERGEKDDSAPVPSPPISGEKRKREEKENHDLGG